MDEVEFMKEEVRQTLLSVKRPGMEKLVASLEESDFYVAPASTKFHLSVPHGLLRHSLNIYHALIEKKQMFKLKISEDTLIIVTLLHDLCKIKAYIQQPDGTYIFNQNPKYKGHGTLSVERIKFFIKITEEEELAIKYHLGLFSCYGYEEFKPSEIHEAIKKYPLVQILASTDMEVTKMEEQH